VDVKVYVRQLGGASLARLLAVLRPLLPFAVLERVDDVGFPSSTEPLLPADWPQGRAFGPTMELCWERQGACFHTLLICEQPPAARWAEHLDLSQCEAHRQLYYLWGPGNVALGRELEYRALPPGRGHPQLLVLEYCDPDTGRLVFAREVEMQREGQE